MASNTITAKARRLEFRSGVRNRTVTGKAAGALPVRPHMFL